MEYRRFLEMIQQEVQKKLGSRAKVWINRTIKNNNTHKESMTILFPKENVSPAIYLDYFYEKYQEGMPLDRIADDIFLLYLKSKRTGWVNIRYYGDFECVKSRIFCKIVNYEKNLAVLDEIPHKRFLDLVIVYYCEVENESLGTGTVLIQNEHLKLWETDPDLLHELAVRNTLQNNPYDLIEISVMMKEMTGIVIDPYLTSLVPMYVLTNVKKYFGAVNLYFPEVLEAVADRLSADFYLLPSSIHECMVIPVNDYTKIKGADYQEMVEEINGFCVDEEEVLGDSVYRYFRDKKELCIIAQSEEDAGEDCLQ